MINEATAQYRQGVSGLGAVFNLPVLPLCLSDRTHTVACNIGTQFQKGVTSWWPNSADKFELLPMFHSEVMFLHCSALVDEDGSFSTRQTLSLIVIDWQTKLFKKTLLGEQLLEHFCKYESLPYNCLFPCHRIQARQNMWLNQNLYTIIWNLIHCEVTNQGRSRIFFKKSQIIFCKKIYAQFMRNADDVQWTRKCSLPRQQIGGSSLLIGRLKRSTLLIGLAIMYHVSSFLYSILMGLLPRPW